MRDLGYNEKGQLMENRRDEEMKNREEVKETNESSH